MNVVIADVVTIKKPKLEHSKFGEFEFVKRGDIINAKDLHPEDWDWIWRNGEIFGRHKVRRMICTIELHPDRHPKLTADSGGWWANMLQVVNPREFIFRLHLNGQDSGKGGYHHPYGYSMQSRTRETKKAIFIADPQRCNELPADSSNLHTSDIPEVTPPIYLFLESPPVCILGLVSWAEGHSRMHFWSYDETSRPEIPESEYGRLRLPMLTSAVVSGSVELRSWPASTYAALQHW
uniref:Uncharacterized protein n=1 Tax=Moniliophthora roreri TaxID=221103 RepID=A0A0W0FJA6_MONRR